MTKKNKPRGLGKGLSALLGDMAVDVETQENTKQQSSEKKTKKLSGKIETPEDSQVELEVLDSPTSGFQNLAIEKIKPNPDQPRKTFDKKSLEELAQSIREKGILQPLIVKATGNEYILIAGERRWRAAQIAKLHKVPALVQEIEEENILEIALIENIQREDLNIVEEAKAYQALIKKFHHRQQDVAGLVGKSRSHIANTLRLLRLPEPLLEQLRSGTISAGHARTLMTAEDPEALASLILEKGLSVRDAEALTKKPKKVSKRSEPSELREESIDILALEQDLTRHTGLTIQIFHKAGEKGEVKIRYLSLEQLDDICKRLSSF